ncbi:MAG TPA: hypothetical protein PKD77_06530 [Rudaea sp.]|nr:hypothetical protein [Rudaea sp.]
MLRPMRLLFLPILAIAANAPVHADILIGSWGDGATPQIMRAFADTANGNVAPLRQLGGTSTGFLTPIGGAYEPVEGVVYVADFYGQSIRVFPSAASGDIAPKRVLTSAYVGQVRSIAIDVAHDEMFYTSTCCVWTFDRTASGNGFFKRYVQWGGLSGSVTQQNSPNGLIYLSATDQLAETDTDSAAPYTPKVLVFDRIASGNTAPARVIKGASTQLGSYAGALAYDAPSRKLFVGAYTDNGASSHSARVLVFDDTANGNVAPLRVIGGANTGLELSGSGSVGGIAIDPQRQRLIVSIYDYNIAANSKLLVFDIAANGNVAPLQIIAGSQTGFVSALGAPIWVSTDRIFGDGFQ